MPLYQYKAKDSHSKTVRGKLEAEDPAALITALREEDLYVLKSREVSAEQTASYRLKPKELAEFSRQIGAMLASGVSLVRALGILLQRGGLKPRLRKIYTNVYKSLQQGNTISEALEAQNGAFPPLMINMFRAGESSGQLDQTAMKTATQYEKEHKLNNKIRSASLYPIILIFVTVVVMFIIFTFVLPSFFEMFEQMNVEVPLLTRIVKGISDFLILDWYWILIGVLCVIAFFSGIKRNLKVRIFFDRCKLRLPVIGKLLRVIYTARFARTLCSLYSSGLSMISALNIAKDIIGNAYISDQFGTVVTLVRNGQPLSKAVGTVDGFDPKLPSTIYVGEETGRLDEMLENIADDFDYESEIASQRLVSILEPVLIVTLAVIIAFIIISVLLPTFTMYQAVGSEGGM